MTPVQDQGISIHLYSELAIRSLRDLPLPDYLQETTKRMLEAPMNLTIEAYERIMDQYCTPDFKVTAGDPETNLLASDLDEHKMNFRGFIKANPEYHVQVQDTTLHLDDRIGRAVVFCTTRVSGLFGAEGVRQSINRVRLKRRSDGTWIAYELSSLRGPGHLTF
ncbi:hypothetical protein DOTSEDRAFT_73998 [Dothistroma septosporum NZE10]|uniref:SnoaL-like domain-containing protein n=1 Tax=Dothistroma septosporum (strain NZE10 / CBS 128990) TaxID=675120 RepID=N1PI32_DOTSN|nr:hypothetical protein DOTSEDRAFT_73998 [Dothistroma septosporum NZE10]